MRHTVRSYRKAGWCRRMVKGASSDHGNQNGSLAVDQEVTIFKGQHCFTAFADKDRNPMNKRKGPWKGMGPLLKISKKLPSRDEKQRAVAAVVAAIAP